MIDDDVIQDIINKVDIVDYIGQYLTLTKKSNDYFCCCPFHNEKTPSFSITPNKKRYYCFGCGEGGNVITFLQNYEGISFISAVQKLTNQYGIKTSTLIKSPTITFLKQANRKKLDNPTGHIILPPNTLSKFEKSDITEWINEGIPQKIMDKYGVMLDKKSNRIVYPVYDFDGNLINIKGRTLYDEYKTLGIPKYINYYKVGDLDYFQGINLKKKLIQQQNEVIIFEGIKSCMKADSYGFYHSVSSETSHLSPYQIKLLLKLKCNVVIAFDKDKAKEKVIKNAEILKKFTNVYIIYDKNNLLGEKDSPVDCGKEVWKTLYEQKERVF